MPPPAAAAAAAAAAPGGWRDASAAAELLVDLSASQASLRLSGRRRRRLEQTRPRASIAVAAAGLADGRLGYAVTTQLLDRAGRAMAASAWSRAQSLFTIAVLVEAEGLFDAFEAASTAIGLRGCSVWARAWRNACDAGRQGETPAPAARDPMSWGLDQHYEAAGEARWPAQAAQTSCKPSPLCCSR